MTHSGGDALPGLPEPLGATVREGGVNFAIYSRHAQRIELCLYDDNGGDATRTTETRRGELTGRTGHVWHGFVPGGAAGQLYGFRVHGPHDPHAGLRFDPEKLLIDPYARVLAGKAAWQSASAERGAETGDGTFAVPRAVVHDDAFDWQDDAPPATPWHETVIYETHVKGFSIRHPEVPPALRGTYLGLAGPAAIEHFRRLGVTAVELLPVHAHVDSKRLVEHGLVNYWGYDSIGFFAPDARFSASGDRGGQVNDFKEMVRELHRHGIEVILDVVFNHTAEGNETGPALSFRGIDNATYYRLDAGDPSRYVNWTGTGNTMDAGNPQVLRLIMDSLRYWVREMHVDGFRFDLAAALVQDEAVGEAQTSFLDAVYQDPIVSRVKLIAEPWHLGPGGYRAGAFPAPWSEWNDKFRDAVRHYWRGDQSKTPELAYRLTGSSDLYRRDGRYPQASINFVTAHDGFTLDDLVTYSTRRNQANGEDNRDGRHDNISWNGGVEGSTSEPAILALRERQKRNFLTTLFFSQGVPMLLGGDEIGRRQRGNNNAYAQDNETSWYNWELDAGARELLTFTRRLSALRRRHPGLRRRGFLHGRPINGNEMKDVTWLRETGQEMTDAEWRAPWVQCFGLRLDGDLADVGTDGAPVVEDSLLLVLNASEVDLDFALPGGAWSLEVDTARPEVEEGAESYAHGDTYPILARSLALLRQSAMHPFT